MKIQEQAPAKINLTLDILGRRSDGYHELRMVMQSVSLCDTVTVEETGTGFTLLADGFTVPAGKSSLEQQAAEAFFAAVGRPVPPLTVHLEKTTPAYAGLGGGSADVAALLRILRDTYAPDLRDETLEAIGLEIGSDMPFCVRGGTSSVWDFCRDFCRMLVDGACGDIKCFFRSLCAARESSDTRLFL